MKHKLNLLYVNRIISQSQRLSINIPSTCVCMNLFGMMDETQTQFTVYMLIG